MANRGERRHKTKNKIIKRLNGVGEGIRWGLPANKKKQPHRMHKHGPKFTKQRGSLKELKQIANRASRKRAKQAIKADKDIPADSKNSVKWDYW